MVRNVYRKVLVAILVISLAMLFFENASAITGHAAQGTAISEVTITSFVAIEMDQNLSDGIIFEDVVALPSTDINATKNYDGVGSATLYKINVATNSNSAVDFCLKADGGLNTTSGDLIGLANETYSTNETTSDANTPALASDISMTTSYDKTAGPIGIGQSNFYRFWLDVPAGQATGTYNNTVSFKGVTAGVNC